MQPTEIIFLVEEAEGGYVARAIDESIFTQAETLEELCKMVRDAVQCHFEENTYPAPQHAVFRIVANSRSASRESAQTPVDLLSP